MIPPITAAVIPAIRIIPIVGTWYWFAMKTAIIAPIVAISPVNFLNPPTTRYLSHTSITKFLTVD